MGAPTPNIPNGGRANAVFLCERNSALWIKPALENTKNVSRREAVMSGSAMPLYVEKIARVGGVLEIGETTVARNSIQVSYFRPLGTRTNKC